MRLNDGVFIVRLTDVFVSVWCFWCTGWDEVWDQKVTMSVELKSFTEQ